MKTTVALATRAFTIAGIALVILMIMLALPTYQTESELVGETQTVQYISVNVRKTPNANGKWLGELHCSDEVTLTGNTCQKLLEEDWYEIEYNGSTAWIVADAI